MTSLGAKPSGRVLGRKLIYLSDLLVTLVGRDLKARYKDSALGLVWAVLHPLLYLMVFYVLFKLVLAVDIRRFGSFTLTGLLVFTWFQASLAQSVSIIKNSRELVRQPGFPCAILPVVAVSANLINLLLSLPILLVLVVLEGGHASLALVLLPLLMAVQGTLILSLSYLLAALNVVFRDTQHILTVVLQLLFYASPIFYAVSMIPEAYRPFYLLNPMVHLIEAYRSVLVDGAAPALAPLAVIALLFGGLLALGYRAFGRAGNRFVEES